MEHTKNTQVLQKYHSTHNTPSCRFNVLILSYPQVNLQGVTSRLFRFLQSHTAVYTYCMTKTDSQKIDQIIDTLGDIVVMFGKRFDAIDARFEGVDSRLDGIDTRLDTIEGRLDGIEDDMRYIKAELKDINYRLDRLEEGVKDVRGFAKEIDDLRTRVRAMEVFMKSKGLNVV